MQAKADLIVAAQEALTATTGVIEQARTLHDGRGDLGSQPPPYKAPTYPPGVQPTPRADRCGRQ